MRHRLFTIRIDLERKVKRHKAYTEYQDEFYYVEICNGGSFSSGGKAFGLPATGKRKNDLKEIFKTIQEELYL